MSVAIYTQNLLIGSQRIGAGSAAAVVVFACIALMVLGYSRLVSVEEV
jgi:ABC-type sugar transport system permease subunit